ncbi:unnamed protein product [Prunus armeniaca]|uniref:Arabinogalactan peptide 23-like n=1 Tax=Prunus armeniaca TaxID=36596 RepID=A0A6J5V0U9_PRUAR|nr:unnamed protein product [Prunus armeniaca]CAB4312129.1 unnamed protein product [Prunus armeniaca]
MEMKKIALAVLMVAVCMSAAMAAGSLKVGAPVEAPSPSATTAAASAPTPSGSIANMPVVGSLVGASLLSLLAFYLH